MGCSSCLSKQQARTAAEGSRGQGGYDSIEGRLWREVFAEAGVKVSPQDASSLHALNFKLASAGISTR